MRSQAQVIIVKSQQGCGGTYLMNTIASQLKDEGNLVCYLLAEQLSNCVKKEPDRFARHLLNQSVVVVDDLDFLIRRNELTCMKWLKNFLHEFIGGGGRFMFSHTSLNITVDDWFLHIGKYKTTEITSTYPSVEILRCIAEQQLPSWIVSKHFEEVHGRSNCTRELLGILISYEARYKLGLPI